MRSFSVACVWNKVIEDHWKEMGKFDAAHRTKLVVDEWGVWYPPGSEIAPAYILSETITLRDAVHTGMTFDIFNRHADKIAMANVAQSVNCIHSCSWRRAPISCVLPSTTCSICIDPTWERGRCR